MIDYMNDPEYSEMQLIVEEEMYNYKELDIKVNESSFEFLVWLVYVKKFDAESLLRVLKNPQDNNQLYIKFLKERDK